MEKQTIRLTSVTVEQLMDAVIRAKAQLNLDRELHSIILVRSEHEPAEFEIDLDNEDGRGDAGYQLFLPEGSLKPRHSD